MGKWSEDLTTQKDWICPPLLDAWYLSGATASGKTEIGLELADRLNAEIISLDSMAVYRGMDIGTAKPSPSQQQRIPHHLLDIVAPTESFSLSQYVAMAHQVASGIRERGKVPLFVGGTPLYLKSMIRGMFLGPEADWEFREAVEADVAEYGLDALRQRLLQIDPLSAHKLLAGDVRRMIRALEVAKVTGKPLSHWQSQFERSHFPQQCRVFVLQWDRPMIHERVNQRVLAMFENGLLSEVEGLVAQHQQLGKTAAQAVGYREVIQHLQGELSLEETIAQVQAHTRQFVRRQEIWFRSTGEIRRVPMAPSLTACEVAEQIVQAAMEG